MKKSPILPSTVLEIVEGICQGEKLMPLLKSMKISPLDFFKHLDSNPDDKILFEQGRRISMEMLIDDASSLYDNIHTRDDLDLAKAKIDLRKWLAEKLIPQTYGTKVQHDVSGTISIRAALGEMDERVKHAIETTAVNVPVAHLPEPEKSETVDPEDLF